MLKSAANPEGLPIEVFDNLRSGITKDRSQFYKNLAVSFSGADWPGALTGHVGSILGSSMQAGPQDAYENIKAFETSRRSMIRPWSCTAGTT
jgi:non-heme chloroperoxidase